MRKNPKKFFSREQETEIVSAIRGAEKKSSGEIRVHLARRSRGSPYNTAVTIFEKLGMTRTRERNGVLIYLSIKDRHFAVIGDTGIHQKVPADFWDKVRNAMQDDFRRGDFLKGLLDGIRTCGEQLALYFPRRSADKNELTNTLSRD